MPHKSEGCEYTWQWESINGGSVESTNPAISGRDEIITQYVEAMRGKFLRKSTFAST